MLTANSMFVEILLRLLLLLGVQQFGESTTCSLQNSSLNLIVNDQWVTKDELKAVLKAELKSLKDDVYLMKQNMGRSNNFLAGSPKSALANQSGDYVCGGTSGWTQVAFIDMTNSSHTCPSGLKLTSYSKRTCGRSNPSSGCSSTSFRVGFTYNQICGRIKAYQWGAAYALHSYTSQSIDGYYLDGVSLTHGCDGERHHIWSFISGYYGGAKHLTYQCPCDVNYAVHLPSFVGGNYFCESAVRSSSDFSSALFPDNPLWDGENCGETGNTCCQVNNPPWFTAKLRNSAVEDIDLRLCLRGYAANSDIAIELIELYVK